MDQAELQKNIALYYSKLTPKAQAVFSGMQWLEDLKRIATKYGINDKQKETLATETTLVLLGMVSLIQYEETLTSELQLSKESVDGMMVEIDQLILKDIRPDLNTAFDANIKAEKEEVPNIEIAADKRFEKLPKDIESVVLDSNYQGLVYSIGKVHGLNVAEMGTLEKDTAGLIAGKIHPEKFEEALGKDLALPPEKTKEIANEVNEKIFKKIRAGVMALEKKDETQIQKEERDVLKNAGIEVVEQARATPVLDKLELEPPQKIKNEVQPILAQKLGGYVQNEVVQTQHSVENVVKKQDTPPPPPPPPQAPPKPTSYPKNQDPYRLPPE